MLIWYVLKHLIKQHGDKCFVWQVRTGGKQAELKTVKTGIGVVFLVPIG